MSSGRDEESDMAPSLPATSPEIASSELHAPTSLSVELNNLQSPEETNRNASATASQAVAGEQKLSEPETTIPPIAQTVPQLPPIPIVSEEKTNSEDDNRYNAPSSPQPLQSEALGPATDNLATPPTPTTASATHSPILTITLLLTTGARHPYKIDEKYLRSRRVEISTGASGTFDPREISGYKLKELIWTDWRSEWEPRPISPHSIRLIILGRLLEDKAALKEFPFKLDDTNVVHMTVKPADLMDDDEAAGKSATGKGHIVRNQDGGERGAGCRCVIL